MRKLETAPDLFLVDDPAAAEPTQNKPGKKKKRKKLAPLLGEGERIDWNTPREIVDPVRRVGRGQIGLDPCSNPRSIVGANVSWSLENGDNGLLQSWAGFGLVYVNPPYGDAIPLWAAKMDKEGGRSSLSSSFGDFATSIIALIPARTDTQWFSLLHRTARCLAFWRGRLTFLGAPDPAPFPSLLPYFGPSPYLFADIFADKAEIFMCGA